MKKAIFLCGFMGVGKSTVAKEIARKSHWPYIDTDKEVVRSSGKSIVEVFNLEGEEGFRRLETSVIKKACELKEVIVSLGGGALTCSTNLDLILKSSRLVYLTATVDTLVLRLKNTRDQRPLLKDFDTGDAMKLRSRIQDLLSARESSYLAAPIKISTDGKTPEQIAQELWMSLEKVEIN